MDEPPGRRPSPPIVAERLRAQGLTGPPATTAEDVVTRLLAIQAQDPRGARLSIRSRSAGLTAADVDAALTAGSLLITWLNRGTLHLVTPSDYWWLHPLTAPQLVTTNRRRLAQEGVSAAQADTGVEVVAAAVASGPQTRADLRRHLQRAGVPTAGQALVHVLLAASIRGLVVRGPVVGGESAYVSVAHWLSPAPTPLARHEALAQLARRYLRGHAPANASDLGKWAGIPLGEARRGLAAVGDQRATEAVPGQGSGPPRSGGRDDRLVRLADQEPPAGVAPPRLLGPFDPLLLGWVSRDPIAGEHRGIATTNGIIRPVGLVGGRVVAIWGLAQGVVAIRPLEPIAPHDLERLQGDANDVLRFLDLPPQPATVTEWDAASFG